MQYQVRVPDGRMRKTKPDCLVSHTNCGDGLAFRRLTASSDRRCLFAGLRLWVPILVITAISGLMQG